MRRCQRAIAFAAGLLLVSAVPLSTGGAAHGAAVNAGAARRVAMIRAQNLQGDAKSMDLDFLPPVEGAARSESPTPPGKWILPGVERVPDNLASNASR